MKSVPKTIQERQIGHFLKADPAYGRSIAEGLAARGASEIRIRARLQACRKRCVMKAPSGAEGGDWTFATDSQVEHLLPRKTALASD